MTSTLATNDASKADSRGAASGSASRVSLRVSVVVPSYLRPTYLVGCLRALQLQTRRPDEVVVVLREDDSESMAALQRFIVEGGGALAVQVRTVSEPGFLPPIRAGIQAARGDVVAFVDDDAEAYPEWLERLVMHYDATDVGGVGGRCVNVDGGREMLYPTAGEVGHFYWFGRAVGNMYREVRGAEARDVDFFMGGNMSYRAELLRAIHLDGNLSPDVAYLYELDLGLQVKSLGYRLVYDPQVKVKHFSAPRPQTGMRVRSRDAAYFSSRNLLYITLKHSRGMRRWTAVAYAFLVGGTHAWGLAAIAAETARLNFLWVPEVASAWRGKMDAVRSVLLRGQVTQAGDIRCGAGR